MNAILPNRILEATRLTREGKLTEASALLQRLLRGEAPTEAPAAAPQDSCAPATRRPSRISRSIPRPVTPPLRPAPRRHRAGPRATQPAAASIRAETASPQGRCPGGARGLLDRIHQGGPGAHLGGLPQGRSGRLTRAAGHRPKRCPTVRSFVTGSFSNQAGSRAYKLYVPSGLSRAAGAAGRHAAWLHPVARRFRRRHAHERGWPRSRSASSSIRGRRRRPTRRNAGTGSAPATSSATRASRR